MAGLRVAAFRARLSLLRPRIVQQSPATRALVDRLFAHHQSRSTAFISHLSSLFATIRSSLWPNTEAEHYSMHNPEMLRAVARYYQHLYA